jgi:hypothetical protein
MDDPGMISTVRYGLEVSLCHASGQQQRDLVLVWEGYLEGLREYELLSEDAYSSLHALLPKVPDNPVPRGLFCKGWADSWDDSPIGG